MGGNNFHPEKTRPELHFSDSTLTSEQEFYCLESEFGDFLILLLYD